jgi:hypothetical protein
MIAKLYFCGGATNTIELESGDEMFLDDALKTIREKTIKLITGDLIKLNDKYFLVDNNKFIQLQLEQAEYIRTINSTDRVKGWEYLRYKFPIGLHIQIITI